MSSPRGNLVSVQLLRAVAASLVVLGHAVIEVEQATGRIFLGDERLGVGVDIFFIVSGFVMWLSSAHLFGLPSGSIEFARRRLWRIVPLYWFYTGAMLLAVAAVPAVLNNAQTSANHVVSSFAFYPWVNSAGSYHPVLSLGWTLNFEMYFYLLFAIGLWFRASIGFVVIAGSILVTVAMGAVLGKGPFTFWGQSIIGEFLLGILLAIAFQRLGARPSVVLFLLTLGVGVLACLTLSHELPRLLYGGVPAVLIFVATVFLAPPSIMRELRSVAAFAGDSSYSLYLSHPFTLAIFKMAWTRFDTDLSHPAAFVVGALVASIGVGRLSFVILERGLLAWRPRRKVSPIPAE